jgi:hypothetical protein
VTTGTTGASGWNTGKEIVEGTAVRVTAAEALQALADAWFAKYGEYWRFEVRGEEFVELSHFRRSTEGRRPGLPGEAGQGHRVRRRARPNHLPPLRLTTRLGSTGGTGFGILRCRPCEHQSH